MGVGRVRMIDYCGTCEKVLYQPYIEWSQRISHGSTQVLVLLGDVDSGWSGGGYESESENASEGEGEEGMVV